MKKVLISIVALGILGTVAGSHSPVGAAASEFWEVSDPSPEQMCVLLGIEREILSTQLKIQEYHPDLLDNPCDLATGGDPRKIDCRFYHISPKTNSSIIPMRLEKSSQYGIRERWFISEMGRITWNKEKIENFEFVQRKSLIGAGNTMVKTLSAPAAPPEKDPGSLDVEECLALPADKRGSPNLPLNMQVREIFSSGRGGVYTFRFPTRKDMQIRQESRLVDGKRKMVEVAYVRDKAEKMLVDGVTENVNVIYVREYDQRIEIAREYLRLLKLMLRRVDWNTRASNFRRIAEIERVMSGN